MPQKLTDLAEGLSYEFVGDEFDDALYQVHIFDKDGLVLRSLVRNAHNKSRKAELYNIAVEESDSSVAGIVPLVSTEADVRRQFGDPTEISMPEESYQSKVYKYGNLPTADGYQLHGQFMTVSFDDSDFVKTIVVNYIE